MPRSANAASSACDAAGEGGIGTPSGMTSEISAGLAQASLDQEVVQHQRGLARGGRALERRRGDTDDDPPAAERVQHVAGGEGAGDGVELVAGLDQPRRRRRVEVGAQGDDQHVGLERRRRPSRPGALPGRWTGSWPGRTAPPA